MPYAARACGDTNNEGVPCTDGGTNFGTDEPFPIERWGRTGELADSALPSVLAALMIQVMSPGPTGFLTARPRDLSDVRPVRRHSRG